MPGIRPARQNKVGAISRAWADFPLRVKGLIVVALPIITLLIAMLLFSVSQRQEQDADARVDHTREVQAQIENLRECLTDAESSVWSYLLLRQDSLLHPLAAAKGSAGRAIDDLRGLTSDNPSQENRLVRIQSLFPSIFECLDSMAASPAGQSSVLPGSLVLVNTKCRSLTSAARHELDEMSTEEERLLATRTDVLSNVRVRTHLGIVITTLCGIGSGLTALLLLTTGIVRRTQTLGVSAQRLAEGRPLLPHAREKDEIGQLAETLDAASLIIQSRERDLRVAKGEADHANQAKNLFLSRMSHELRTPLNAILGFGQLLEMHELSRQDTQSVEQILKAGRHLLELINEVLDISRIEAGQLDLSLEPVRVTEILGQSIDLVRPLAGSMNVRIGDLPETCDCYVVADRQRLRQVLLNLLSNAVKYNREGGSVQFACEVATEGWMRIKLTDTGYGISPEELSKLFTPFERLQASQTTIEGTGIGLALSKRLTEAMGGRVGVESVVEKGSTFWVELPSSETSPVHSASSILEELPVDEGVYQQGLTLLYIEDNLSNLNLIENLLQRLPAIRLMSAMQGSQGLDLARRHLPDLILLDLHLPDMPGDKVLEWLQGSPETRTIPVVILSADATPGQVERLLAGGAKAYLSKPLNLRQLLQVIEENQPAHRKP